jgi:hypothetical protein
MQRRVSMVCLKSSTYANLDILSYMCVCYIVPVTNTYLSPLLNSMFVVRHVSFDRMRLVVSIKHLSYYSFVDVHNDSYIDNKQILALHSHVKNNMFKNTIEIIRLIR